MALIWSELSHDRDQRRRAEFEREARDFWLRLDVARVPAALPSVFADAGLEVEWDGAEWVVRYADHVARASAELLRATAADPFAIRLGQQPEPFEVALARARSETGVALDSARVRVGLTRGHLWELVFTVPLDVEGDEEQLQLAAEIFVESCVGERLLDDWVASVEVTRSARQRGLLVLREPAPSTTYPLVQTSELLGLGIAGIVAGLPDSLVRVAGGEWTALDIPAATTGLQPERLFASTLVPEALKAALEGLPFHSGRFTRGSEIFGWLEWSTVGLEPVARRQLRDERERSLCRSFEANGMGRFVGSGFGAERDYLDVVVDCRVAAIAETLRAALAVECAHPEAAVEFGFYDSIWADERLHFDRNGARAASYG